MDSAAGPSRPLECSLVELGAFIQLVESASFTAAASALHISQPGLSARIARLERGLGYRLVDRSVRRLTLTPEGQRFLPFAREALAILQDGVHVARSAAGRRGARQLPHSLAF